jgi:hypothetical protein
MRMVGLPGGKWDHAVRKAALLRLKNAKLPGEAPALPLLQKVNFWPTGFLTGMSG